MVKKMVFKESYRKKQILFEDLGDVAGVGPDSIKVVSRDSTHDIIDISNDEDIDFLIEENKGSKFIELNIIKKDFNSSSCQLSISSSNKILRLSTFSFSAINSPSVCKQAVKRGRFFTFSIPKWLNNSCAFHFSNDFIP